MVSDAQKKASARYDLKNTVQIKLKLNKQSDKDVLDKLEEVDNKQGYIKGLIRDDIKRYDNMKLVTIEEHMEKCHPKKK